MSKILSLEDIDSIIDFDMGDMEESQLDESNSVKSAPIEEDEYIKSKPVEQEDILDQTEDLASMRADLEDIDFEREIESPEKKKKKKKSKKQREVISESGKDEDSLSEPIIEEKSSLEEDEDEVIVLKPKSTKKKPSKPVESEEEDEVIVPQPKVSKKKKTSPPPVQSEEEDDEEIILPPKKKSSSESKKGNAATTKVVEGTTSSKKKLTAKKAVSFSLEEEDEETESAKLIAMYEKYLAKGKTPYQALDKCGKEFGGRDNINASHAEFFRYVYKSGKGCEVDAEAGEGKFWKIRVPADTFFLTDVGKVMVDEDETHTYNSRAFYCKKKSSFYCSRNARISTFKYTGTQEEAHDFRTTVIVCNYAAHLKVSSSLLSDESE
jgi:phosphoribosylformylglycinamidine (FGAM) synthase PurS component